jgi:hypothetical protein
MTVGIVTQTFHKLALQTFTGFFALCREANGQNLLTD